MGLILKVMILYSLILTIILFWLIYVSFGFDYFTPVEINLAKTEYIAIIKAAIIRSFLELDNIRYRKRPRPVIRRMKEIELFENLFGIIRVAFCLVDMLINF